MDFKIVVGRIGTDIWANIRLKGILRELGHIKDKKILDIGCENTPYIGGCFIKNNKVTFTDLHKKNLDKIKYKNCKKIVLDLTKKSKLKENYFDIIICADVIEHIEKEKLAIHNLVKLLKKDGKLILTFPAYSKLYGIHDKMIGHFRRYDLQDLYRIEKEHGLKLSKNRYLVSLLLPFFILLQKNEDSKSIYEGKSKFIGKITSLLNTFCIIDESLRLPFGICIMGVFKKNKQYSQ